MEACASAHHWGREIRKLGHDVQLLPPQHVKGYLRGQKNDYNDARKIVEASLHGAIRQVSIKNLAQQDEQSFLQMRRHLSTERTRLINHIRGLMAEYGVVLPIGSQVLRQMLPHILENTEEGLTDYFKQLLRRQQVRLISLDEELAWYDEQLKYAVKQDETCQQLMTLPDFGPVVSYAVKAWIAEGKQYKRGRDALAAQRLVPRQFSTGGREVLLGITKRGDKNLRSLVIHGAQAVVSQAKTKTDRLSLWINHLVLTRGFNKATVALENKLDVLQKGRRPYMRIDLKRN
ncbi:IS110 family RNA-guided transposase [Enterovibrio calviensis]|uniref:IS110 family transposase n=1 Tax=Enterovibrio calviensis TaxID=91359 RepID=UPI000A9AE60A|nr:IS110 family transposase [Enterovibrio calviensis]